MRRSRSAAALALLACLALAACRTAPPAGPPHAPLTPPAGQARIHAIPYQPVQVSGPSRTVPLYMLSGLGFTPGYVWLDDSRELFASVGGWAALFREGWVDVVPQLTKAQDAAEKGRFRD